MKLVTVFADLEGERCINFFRYSTKLLAFARNARFSSISTATTWIQFIPSMSDSWALKNSTPNWCVCKSYWWVFCKRSHVKQNHVGFIILSQQREKDSSKAVCIEFNFSWKWVFLTLLFLKLDSLLFVLSTWRNWLNGWVLVVGGHVDVKNETWFYSYINVWREGWVVGVLSHKCIIRTS